MDGLFVADREKVEEAETDGLIVVERETVLEILELGLTVVVSANESVGVDRDDSLELTLWDGLFDADRE
jgi:hypothetical protein